MAKGSFTDLLQAVLQHDISCIKTLVQRGLEVNCRDSMKRTVLHHAAEHYFWGKPHTVIKKLVELGADINAKDMLGMTPLHYLVTEKAVLFKEKKLEECPRFQKRLMRIGRYHVERRRILFCDMIEKIQTAGIRHLVKLGADINAKFQIGVTSLHRAVQVRHVRSVHVLVKLGVNVNKQKSFNMTMLNFVPVLESKFMSNIYLVRLIECLVELGADMNRYHHIYPIHQAVELGSLDIVRILLENGAHIDVLGRYNFSPVHQNYRSKSVIKYLVKCGADLNAKMDFCSVIQQAVQMGHTTILEYLVNRMEIGASDRSDFRLGYTLGGGSRTLLSLALHEDDQEMVKFLVRSGADVNARYDANVPPLAVAVRQGNTKMVRTLVILGANIDHAIMMESVTVLHQACSCSLGQLKFLLDHGGDVNVLLKCGLDWNLVYETVVQNDTKMLRVLSELGADLNAPINEGMHFLHCIALLSNTDQIMGIVKVLVEAGIDLNITYNSGERPIHEAVKRGNVKMIQTLGELKADMNCGKFEGHGVLLDAIRMGKVDILQFIASQESVKVNVRHSCSVAPLHDAVRLGNPEIIENLIAYGAKPGNSKYLNSTALDFAIRSRNHEMVKCLILCGADVNTKTGNSVSVLHDAIESLDSNTCMTVARAYFKEWEIGFRSDVTPLIWSIFEDQFDIAETLLLCGADKNATSVVTFPSDAALEQGKLELAAYLAWHEVLWNGRPRVSREGICALQRACYIGHLDLVRLLLIHGCDTEPRDCYGMQPFDHLPMVFTADYGTLRETLFMGKVAEEVPVNSVSVFGCKSMQTLLETPGIGDVNCITTPSSKVINQRITTFLKTITYQGKMLPWTDVEAIGSAAEGTNVGLPNEMDFMFFRQLGKGEEQTIRDFGKGYVQFDYTIQECLHSQHPPLMYRGSAGFHFDFSRTMEVFGNYLSDDYIDKEKKLRIRSSLNHGVRDTDRKACSSLTISWRDAKSREVNSEFVISVDFVPSLHVDGWPEGAITQTWLMDEEELRSRGYVLVPKPPHVASDLAKECTQDQLQVLWKISFPHLETEHMQRLEERVKDVYLTAKCLRNPDACRIMITDKGSSPRNINKYLTSYLLKMCFFKNVERFRKTDLRLEEMVCQVYQDLEEGLSKGFIPLFFLPKVNALGGIKLNVSNSAKVAMIMLKFVRALYLRDCTGDEENTGAAPQKLNSVYRTYEINSQYTSHQ